MLTFKLLYMYLKFAESRDCVKFGSLIINITLNDLEELAFNLTSSMASNC